MWINIRTVLIVLFFPVALTALSIWLCPILWVQERFLLFFWTDSSRAFDKISEAQAWIRDQNVRQVITVVNPVGHE